jgi:hypothetical protein
MHSTCSSSNHFCHQVRQTQVKDIRSVSPLTASMAYHHHHDDLAHKPICSAAYPEPSPKMDWQFMSLPLDACDATQTVSYVTSGRPCSALPFDCPPFLEASDASTSAFPFSIDSYEPEVFEEEEAALPGTSGSSAAPASPIEQWGNHLIANIRQLKSWWQSRRRRNSKELINRANADDKHVRSRFSLTCDEKLARKQLEHLIKNESKKQSKVRFDCSAPYGSSGRITSSPEVPVVIGSDRHSITSTASLTRPRLSTSGSGCGVSEVFQQRLAQIKRKLLQGTDQLLIPGTGSTSSTCSNELIASGQHVYCASKVGARRRTIPKLFQAQQSQLHPLLLLQTPHDPTRSPARTEQDKHLALTKARTLSMEAKSAVCDSFLATWPTSSIVIGSENDFLPTEAELNSHLS